MVDGIVWKLFLWLGTKLFDQIGIYAPGGDNADVLAITFSNDSDYISKVGMIERPWPAMRQAKEVS